MKSQTHKRKDKKGRLLNAGEYQKSDGRYEYRYKDSRGESHSVYSWKLTASDPTPKGRAPEPDLRSMEREIQEALHDGINQHDAERITLNQCFDRFIEGKVELKASTRTNYKYMYDTYVRNDFGKQTMASISYSGVLDFYKSLIYERNFKPNSMETIHSILNPIFRTAVRDGLIRYNPAQDCMGEIKRSRDWENTKRMALTKEQQTAFMSYIEGHKVYNKWVPIMTVLLGTGMRIGEALGLTWDDCDFEEGIISVNHSLLYRKQDGGGCEYHIELPKTKNSIRTIPMFDVVREALLHERERQAKVGASEVVIDGVTNWVFTNRYNTVFSPASINRVIDRIVVDYNCEEHLNAKKERRKPVLLPDFSAHNLRHTFCTRYCEVEPRVKVIQAVMGHADIATTLDIYTDVSESLKKESFNDVQSKVFIK